MFSFFSSFIHVLDKKVFAHATSYLIQSSSFLWDCDWLYTKQDIKLDRGDILVALNATTYTIYYLWDTSKCLTTSLLEPPPQANQIETPVLSKILVGFLNPNTQQAILQPFRKKYHSDATSDDQPYDQTKHLHSYKLPQNLQQAINLEVIIH